MSIVPNNISRKAAGFTLIEVLISVAIVAGIGLILYLSTSQAIRLQDLTASRDEQMHAVTVSFSRLGRDLAMAYMIKSRELLPSKFNGDIDFLGTEDRLDFVSFSHQRYIAATPEDESAEFSYYLEKDPDRSEDYRLMRRESTEVDGDFKTGSIAYPLMTGIKSWTLEYLASDAILESDEWKKEWNTQNAESGQRLPRFVRVTLKLVLPGDAGEKSFITILPIHAVNPLLI